MNILVDCLAKKRLFFKGRNWCDLETPHLNGTYLQDPETKTKKKTKKNFFLSAVFMRRKYFSDTQGNAGYLRVVSHKSPN